MKPAIKTLKKTAITCATLVSTTLLSAGVMAADATIPSSFVGTYSLTYEKAQPGAPVPNGTELEAIITQGGTLCLAGFTLTDPVTANGNPAEAIWSATDLDIKVALSNIQNSFNEFNLATISTKQWLGQLKGSKVSNSTAGCATAGPDLSDIDKLFAAAEKHFADLFPGSANIINEALDQFTYRYYPTTKLYLGIADGQVYVMGGAFGDEPAPQGSLQDLLSQFADEPIDIPDVPALEGDYRLVVDGTMKVQMQGISVPATPFSVTIDKIAAPTSSDIDDIREAVKDSLKDINFVGTISVSEVSSSDASLVFVIEFSGSITSNGTTVQSDYKLRYTYTKL